MTDLRSLPGGARASANGGPGLDEIDILWISEGMSCDGDTVSVTAAVEQAARLVTDVVGEALTVVVTPTRAGEV